MKGRRRDDGATQGIVGCVGSCIVKEGGTFWLTESYRFYRRRLPHWREKGSIYFVTWRTGKGRLRLASPERAEVVSAIKHFEGFRYELYAYVVMDDHVHVVVRPFEENELESIVSSWKSFSAHRIQSIRKSRGSVWQREYFDRIVRDEKELEEKRGYIQKNPFKRWPDLERYPWFWPQFE